MLAQLDSATLIFVSLVASLQVDGFTFLRQVRYHIHETQLKIL